MRTFMKTVKHLLLISLSAALLSACDIGETDSTAGGHDLPDTEYERGEHGGRLLTDGAFTLELAIFETGVPPEFRAWAMSAGVPIDPNQVQLNIELTRLGDRIDEISFNVQDDHLRGDTVVYEPHSFVVTIVAQVNGNIHRWQYDNFEGRTQISNETAKAFKVETSIATPAVLTEMVNVYGRIEPNSEQMRIVNARFEGDIISVQASVGERVKAGQPLIAINSNESLHPYTITAPIAGVITERNANTGEQTNGRRLFTIMNMSSVWADLAVFPADQSRVRVGAPVTIKSSTGESITTGTVSWISLITDTNQAVTARVVLDNPDGAFMPGMHVRAQIKVDEFEVPLAVKRTGLQTFRDFTVVYAQFEDMYEVRMLDLGRQDKEWVEVLGGLEVGTRYVSANSYLIKADIEKSGASHDH